VTQSAGEHILQFLGLPKLKIEKTYRCSKTRYFEFEVHSMSQDAICKRCATLSTRIYDTRQIRLKDAPLRDHKVSWKVFKRRYYCKPCKRPFTELLEGVFSRSRITDRLRRAILFDGKKSRTLKDVAKTVGLTLTTVQRHFYSALRVDQGRHLNYPWPKIIGIDEKRFGKNPSGYGPKFHTIITDMVNDRVYDILFTKSSKVLFAQLLESKSWGMENVENVSMDLCEGYRSLSRALFPRARITADKFHVVKLLTPAINQRRKKLAGDRRTNPIGNLLLRSGKNLGLFERSAVHRWLSPHEELKIIYEFKERIHGLYRVRGFDRATRAFDFILEDLKKYSLIKELRTLRWTLTRWRVEILNYFITGLTNAMAEGFNNKISILKNNAYGYINENNFKLRALSACL